LGGVFFFGYLFYNGFMGFTKLYVSLALIGLRFGLMGFLRIQKELGDDDQLERLWKVPVSTHVK
jgi:hypothetical protein